MTAIFGSNECVGCGASKVDPGSPEIAYLNGVAVTVVLAAYDRDGLADILHALCDKHRDVMAALFSMFAKANNLEPTAITESLNKFFEIEVELN